MIIEFKHKALVAGLQKTCLIHEDFENSLKLLCDKAFELGLKLSLNSSFREDSNVQGAIVEPSKVSNHMVGHAIDCNVWEGKKFWNSKDLEVPKGNIKKLIEYAEGNGMRWGGRFQKVDAVHYDSGLNVRDFDKWKKIYNEIHQNA